MAVTKRKEILDDLVYRMGAIRKANGYETDLGVTVTRLRDTDAEPFDQDEVPALNIRDGIAVVYHNVSDDEHSLEIELTVHTTSQVTSAEVDAFIGDIVRCIDENDTWGGHADGTDVESHEIDTTQTSDTITAGTVRIKIRYTTEKGKI
jgi:hypothetical protein